MLQLLRPNSSNLPCLYSTFHLEYPLVLSRVCFLNALRKILNFQFNLNSSWCITRNRRIIDRFAIVAKNHHRIQNHWRFSLAKSGGVKRYEFLKGSKFDFIRRKMQSAFTTKSLDGFWWNLVEVLMTPHVFILFSQIRPGLNPGWGKNMSWRGPFTNFFVKEDIARFLMILLCLI